MIYILPLFVVPSIYLDDLCITNSQLNVIKRYHETRSSVYHFDEYYLHYLQLNKHYLVQITTRKAMS